MKTILYVVSSLKSCGPTKQLSYIIKYLDKSRFKVVLVTLSNEPADSRWQEFKRENIDLRSLGLSRFIGLFKAKSKLRDMIDELNPSVIHTQGVRADSLLSKMYCSNLWLMTARNYPWDDYPMKFGRIVGFFLALQHVHAMRKCRHVIACSESIQFKLKTLRVNARVIPNGAELSSYSPKASVSTINYPRPIFITVGSLIKRKNIAYLIEAFNAYLEHADGSLVILGDGPEFDKLSENALGKIYFCGQVKNVDAYLAASDFFVSSSLSEGLPNAVLEALFSGVPSILSNIPSHEEIKLNCPESCKIFSLEDGVSALIRALHSCHKEFAHLNRDFVKAEVAKVYSAHAMSLTYQEYYENL